MPGLTVVLPCAGEGSRLGLSTPKELFEILPGIRLIDFSIRHIRAYIDKLPSGLSPFPQTPENLKVAVVIRPWKISVLDYVASQLPEIAVEKVLFNDEYLEWPGSVYSAEEAFSEFNLVLLPDSFLCLGPANFPNVVCHNKENRTLLDLAVEKLEKYPVIFGSVPCEAKEHLAKLGAMKVVNGEITAFQDKPRHNIGLFDCFWGCYGFRGACGRSLYNYLIDSVRHRPVELEKQAFYPAGAVPLYSYRDLGTWDNINRFRDDFCINGH